VPRWILLCPGLGNDSIAPKSTRKGCCVSDAQVSHSPGLRSFPEEKIRASGSFSGTAVNLDTMGLVGYRES
jgi:hypothetical protein